jgi:hypothetical protein
MVRFAVLAETSHKFKETWLWFLQFEGNEQELTSLGEKLLKTQQTLESHLSIYKMGSQTVSEQTAKEMCEIKINNAYHNQIMCGKMAPVPYVVTDTLQTNVLRLHELLNEGKIRQYFDKRWTFQTAATPSTGFKYTFGDNIV